MMNGPLPASVTDAIVTESGDQMNSAETGQLTMGGREYHDEWTKSVCMNDKLELGQIRVRSPESLSSKFKFVAGRHVLS